jgi:hypothetical protein
MTKVSTFSLLAVLLNLTALSGPTLRAQDQERRVVVQDVKALPGAAKRYALIIGVDQYADTQISTLGGASNDAQALADALITYAGFAKENIALLTSRQPAERQPTRGNILRRLSNLAAVIPKDGLLLFAFAGHGIERDGRAFLLPADAQLNNEDELLEMTADNFQHVKERIKKIGVGQVVMLLDACRNDPGGRAEADNLLTKTYTSGFSFDLANREVQAFVTLYATAVGQRAYEYRERQQGYFTWALVEGLKGEAANARGEVTLAGLIQYLQERVPKQVLLDLGAGKVQRPYAEINGYKADELILSVVGKGKTGTATSTEPFEITFWESIKDSKAAEDFKAYLKEYPNGRFATLARLRLEALAKASAPITQPTNDATPLVGVDELGIAGTWTGTRGMIEESAFLFITGSRGEVFSGVMKLKGYEIAVSGQVNLKTRQLTLQETAMLKVGSDANLVLSSYTGSLSRDKRQMSGLMYEGNDKTRTPVGWSFTKSE